MAVSGYSHIWESKQYYRAWWSMGYLQQGHIDPSLFLLLLLLLFLWVFFGVALIIKLLSVHSPCAWFVSSLLRLVVRVITKLAGRLTKGR